MANVIDLTVHRQAKSAAQKPALTILQLTIDAVDFLLGDWEKMVRSNRLNDYFKSSLPSLIDQETRVNFMSDLTEVANLELKLDLFPMIFFPGTTRAEQTGWIVQFKIGGEIISTPEMASECYARCFGILLYLKVKRAALDIGVWK